MISAILFLINALLKVETVSYVVLWEKPGFTIIYVCSLDLKHVFLKFSKQIGNKIIRFHTKISYDNKDVCNDAHFSA